MQEIKIDKAELEKAVEEGRSNLVPGYCFCDSYSYVDLKGKKYEVPPQVCKHVNPDSLNCIPYSNPAKKCRVMMVPGKDDDGTDILIQKVVLGCNFSPVAEYEEKQRQLKAMKAQIINPLKASKRKMQGMQ